MSIYSIEHVMDECVNEKSKGLAPGVKREQYEETWNALNTWLKTRLYKRKGAELSFLGTFTYELRAEDDGTVSSRPIFLLNDGFVKDFNIKRQRISYTPKTVKNEKINFSKIAIKYTPSLTKDMVFSSVRDLMRKIGDFAYRGYEFEIPLSIGTIKGKERRIKFIFDSIIEDNIALDIDSLEDADMTMASTINEERNMKEMENLKNDNQNEEFTEEAPSSSSSSSAVLANKPIIPPLELTQQQPEEIDLHNQMMNEEIDEEDEEDKGNYGDENYEYNDNYDDNNGITYLQDDEEESEVPLTPGIHDMLMSLGPVTKETRKQRTKIARESVAQQAFSRCIGEVEEAAKVEALTREYMKKEVSEWRAEEIKKREDQAVGVKTLRSILSKQVDLSDQRKNKEKSERVNASLTYKLPGTVPDHLLPHPKPTKKEMQKQLFSSLDLQMRMNKTKAELDRERKIQEEKEYLDHVSMEIDLQSAIDRMKHLEQQKVLLDSWEKEGHIRNLERLRDAGKSSLVSTYINDNWEPATGPATGAMKGMSVGYDTRK